MSPSFTAPSPLLAIVPISAVCTICAASLPSQTVWRVGGNHPIQRIQVAIDRAAPGDIVLVSPGNEPHEGFTLNKGLTVRGPVTIAGNYGFGRRYRTRIVVPTGQVAHLQDLRFEIGDAGPAGPAGHEVTVGGGRVSFEDCSLRSSAFGTPLIVGSSDVTLLRATVTSTASAPAIDATGSLVTLRDASVRGGDSGCAGRNGCQAPTGPECAVALVDCRLHVERTPIHGGSNSWGHIPDGSPAVETDATSRVWVADSQLRGGDAVLGTGGTALVHGGRQTARLRNTTLTGGSPGGRSSTGPVDTNAPLSSLELGPFARGGAVTLRLVAAAPALPASVWFAADARSSTTPLVDEPVWSIGPHSFPLFFGNTDAQGALAVTFTVPNDAALEHRLAWLQGVAGNALPLHASTIAGGVIR